METNWRKQTQLAQGMVEFALVLPILLLMILAIFAFGHFMFAYITTASASREAARYGAAIGPSENGIPRFEDCQAIRQSARRVSSIIGVANVSITFDNGSAEKEDCNGERLSNPNIVGLGDRIVVEVVTNYTPIVPLVNIPSFPIKSRSVRTILRAAPVGTAEIALPGNSPTKENTTVLIVSDQPDYSVVGVPVEIVITLAHTGTGPEPTGTVMISGTDKDTSDTSPDVSCTITLPADRCTVTPDTSGLWSLKALYPGDMVYNGSQDNDDHQVYYETTVSIESMSPADYYLGRDGELQVNYKITPNPAVNGSDKPIKLEIGTGGVVLCDISDPDWTGTCTLPAFTTSGLKTIDISLPSGDPNFLPSTGSATLMVQGGQPTITTIIDIVNGASKPDFQLGDTARIKVQVEGPSTLTEKPIGTVLISGGGLSCTATLDGNGVGECPVTIGSIGSGSLTFTAAFTPVVQPNYPIFDTSTSGPRSINVNKAAPNLTLLGRDPAISGVTQNVRITAHVSPPFTSIMPSGTVRISSLGENLSCDAAIDTNSGQASCYIAFTTPGLKDLRLEYLGDSNWLPTVRDYNDVHDVKNCPTIPEPRFVNRSGNGNNAIDSQIILSLVNPNPANYRIVEVNASWPTMEKTLYITELQHGPVGLDSSSWECSKRGNDLPPYCLWSSGTGLTAYYATAAQGQSCQGAPGGTCLENWKPSSETNASDTLPMQSSTGLYFVLSHDAPSLYSYSFKVRLENLSNPGDQTCSWVTAEYKRP